MKSRQNPFQLCIVICVREKEPIDFSRNKGFKIMRDLQVYISILEPQLLGQITGRMGDLIRAIQRQNFISEDALKQHFIGTENNANYYYNLKSKTLTMLQALAIVSTIKEDSEVKKKLDLCRKKFLLGQKFLAKGSRKEGIRLIKQAHKIAIEYEFVHMASELSSMLYHHHASSSRNWKVAVSYADQVKKYSEYYLEEKKVENYFYQIIGYRTGALKAKGLKSIVEQITQIKGKTLKCKTYQAISQVLYGRSCGDYELMINSSQKALHSFEGKKGVYSSHYHFFLTNIATAQIAKKNYAHAEKNLAKASNYAYHRSKNAYIIELYQTICDLHSGQYLKAYQNYKLNKKCKFEDIRQQFAIIEAYMCFLSRMGCLQLESKFRMGKYLNETIQSQTDKEGSNINVLIAELLIYFVRDKGKFIDRIEAINNYSYRFLKSDYTKRAKYFLKILCLMPRANFNPITIKRIAASSLNYLKMNPIGTGKNVFIEIIPFENLLQMILQHLERKAA